MTTRASKPIEPTAPARRSPRPPDGSGLRPLAGRIARRLGLLLLLVLLALLAALAVLRMLAQGREVQPRGALAPASGEFVAVGDTELFVQQAGPRDGPPVVLIHGLGAWSETWRVTIDALAADGYRVIALDLPPFGLARPPANGDYSTEASARRILAVLDALGVARATLVGHSFGGRATVQAAMQAPARVESLVLVTVALGLPEGDVTVAQSAPALASVLLGNAATRETLVAATATNPWLTRFFIEQFTARHDALSDVRMDVYRWPLTAIDATPAIGAWARQFVLQPGSPASAQPARYRRLDIPTLVLWGELDRVTPLPQGERLAKLLPNARLEVLSGIGHIPQLEDAARFNARLLEELRRTAALATRTAGEPGAARASGERQ